MVMQSPRGYVFAGTQGSITFLWCNKDFHYHLPSQYGVNLGLYLAGQYHFLLMLNVLSTSISYRTLLGYRKWLKVNEMSEMCNQLYIGYVKNRNIPRKATSLSNPKGFIVHFHLTTLSNLPSKSKDT